MSHPAARRDATEVLVFGSNLAGRHTEGEALTALRRYGAAYGRAVGLMGRSYAIPVRDERDKPLPIPVIERYVGAFLRFAATHRELLFRVTRIGVERNAYDDDEIAPLFAQAPPNCHLPGVWRDRGRRVDRGRR